MNSNDVEQLVQKSIEKQDRLADRIEKLEKRLKEEENADLEERNKNRALYTIVPYFCSALAAIGLSKVGIVDPNYVGMLAIGASATIGAVIESKKVRKVVSSRTLNEKGSRILKNKVYDALELEKIKQDYNVEDSKLEELEDIANGIITSRYENMEEAKKECESALHDLAIVKGLLKEIPNNEDSTLSKTVAIRDAALYSLGMFAGYSIPMSIAGADSNALMFIPPIVYAIASLNFHLARSKDKRKMDKKYRTFLDGSFSDADIEHLELLSSIYSRELGIIEAKLATETPKQPEETVEETSVFVEVWEEMQKDKDKTLLKK